MILPEHTITNKIKNRKGKIYDKTIQPCLRPDTEIRCSAIQNPFFQSCGAPRGDRRDRNPRRAAHAGTEQSPGKRTRHPMPRQPETVASDSDAVSERLRGHDPSAGPLEWRIARMGSSADGRRIFAESGKKRRQLLSEQKQDHVLPQNHSEHGKQQRSAPDLRHLYPVMERIRL